MRQVFDKGLFMGGALASMMTVTKGRAPNGRFPTHPNASASLKKTGRASRYPAPDGTYIFDKLSSVFASGNRTRDDQPDRLKVRATVRRPVAEAWGWMCPAHVYEVGRDVGDGMVDAQDHAVELRPVRRRSRRKAAGSLRPRAAGAGVHLDLRLRLEGARHQRCGEQAWDTVPNTICAGSGGAGSPRNMLPNSTIRSWRTTGSRVTSKRLAVRLGLHAAGGIFVSGAASQAGGWRRRKGRAGRLRGLPVRPGGESRA